MSAMCTWVSVFTGFSLLLCSFYEYRAAFIGTVSVLSAISDDDEFWWGRFFLRKICTISYEKTS